MNLTAARWMGPALGTAGIAALGLITVQPLGSRDLVSWWILQRALSVENAIPLIGLGAAMALVGPFRAVLAAAMFVIGTVVGFRFHHSFIAFMAFAPNAADHLFLTVPVSLLFAGLPLIAPRVLKGWLVFPAAFAIGAMLAIIIGLTDPTLNGWKVSVVGVGLALWLVTTVALTIGAFYQTWFPIGFRIVGSWLLAIGLLYGGTSLVVRPPLPSLPEDNFALPPPRNDIPQFDQAQPGMPPDGLRVDP
jgi:hypothetical protein